MSLACRLANQSRCVVRNHGTSIDAYLAPTFAPIFTAYSRKALWSSIPPHNSPHLRTFTRREEPEIEPGYGFQEDVERFKGYVPGGYHPVHLGDELANGRYRIVHKLGYGAYSTVWLARDQFAEKYVAVKIAVACLKSTQEPSILRHLGDADHKTLAGRGQNLVSSLLDEFQLDGPNGRHTCLISEPAGCTIADSKEAGRKWIFPLATARAIITNLFQAVAFMHDNGVVHADLHSGNILLRLGNLDSLSVEELYTRLGEPQKTPIIRTDGRPLGPGVPEYSVQPACTCTPSDELTDPTILICDLGEAFMADKGPHHQLHTPLLLCPPEMIFADASVGKPADIWALACTIHDIMGERPLFEGFWVDRNDVAAEMVSALGRPPASWWNGWQHRDEFFLEDGTRNVNPKRWHDSRSLSLEARVKLNGRVNDFGFTSEEQAAWIELLRAMLIYEPEKRMTIREALDSTWVKQYGFPSCEPE